jgi:hypothetical protein
LSRLATKAQVIFVPAERGVELRRVFLYQKTEMFTAMANVTTLTILLGNRSVQKFFVLGLFVERLDYFVFAYADRFIMA